MKQYAKLVLFGLPIITSGENIRKVEGLDNLNQRRPNFIVIVADDLGWNDVGYHQSEIRTPQIDRLSKLGRQLDQFYVCPVCTPTRASLLTGRYPFRYGLQKEVIWPWEKRSLPLEEKTIANELFDLGYETAICGKWHLGHAEKNMLPMQRGFQHAYGHYVGAINYITHEKFNALDWHRDGELLEETGYSTDLIAKEACRIIREKSKDKPLFLYIPFNAPHSPLMAPVNAINQYRSIADEKRRTYAAMVSVMDSAIGKIFQVAQDCLDLNNTFFLFFSDNGGLEEAGGRNQPLKGEKGSLYQGGVKVPAIAFWKGKIEGGEPITQAIHVTDCFPTLMKWAGGNKENGPKLDGKDISEVLFNNAKTPHKEIVLNATDEVGAIICGDWKLVKNPYRNYERINESSIDTYELYNIAYDPCEKINLFEKYPKKVKKMRGLLDKYIFEAKPCFPVSTMPSDWQPPKYW